MDLFVIYRPAPLVVLLVPHTDYGYHNILRYPINVRWLYDKNRLYRTYRRQVATVSPIPTDPLFHAVGQVWPASVQWVGAQYYNNDTA